MAGGFRSDLNRAAIRSITTGQSGPVWKYANNLGRRTTNRAKIGAPVDTGRLRADHQFTVRAQGNEVIVRIGTGVEYAMAVHEGHGPLQAAPGKVFRFVIGGEVIYATKIKAVPPNPWLANAVTAETGLAVRLTH